MIVCMCIYYIYVCVCVCVLNDAFPYAPPQCDNVAINYIIGIPIILLWCIIYVYVHICVCVSVFSFCIWCVVVV